jgi:putative ABC transport system permease protein
MDRLLADISYAFRMFAKNPGFTLVALVTLALGIGANTTIFSVINAVLLKPIPFANSDRLVALFEADARKPTDESAVSAPNYQDWEQQNRVFEQMALVDAGGGYDLSSRGQQPERVTGSRVTAGFFKVFGVQPFMGRNFLPEEEQLGRNHEVILSYGLWSQRYHADRNIVGRSVKVNGEGYAVVGVMPSSFQFQFFGEPDQLWVPIGYTPGDRGRGSHSFVAFGLLKPDITVARARAEMDSMGRRLAKEYPDDNTGRTVAVDPLNRVGMSEFQATLMALLAAVGFVLLMACVNVANLMLARGASRQKEFALRCAMRAGRGQVVRQLITESVVLALLGGGCGIFVAVWATDLLVHVLPSGLRFVPFRPLDGISIDANVWLFAFLISCLTGVLFGLTPALSAFRTDVNDLLKQGGRSSTHERGSRLRYVLVASEVALAMIVLTGAGLMIDSMARLLGVKPGFDPKNVLTMSVSSPQLDLYNGPPVRQRFCLDLDERVATLPGVVSVSSVGQMPFRGWAGRGFVIQGQPDPGPENQPGARYGVACPGYLRTLKIPLIKGRDFSHRDTVGAANVILINQAMARQYWPHADPLGKRIKIGLFNADGPWLTIVGVYADVRSWGLDEEFHPQFLRPYTQAGWPSMTLVVRTSSAPGALIGPVKNALAQIDPDLAASPAETLEEVLRDSVGSRRFPMLILAVLAALALTLASVGIAGVVSYSVAQRTNEIGIRMALGARALDVLRLVITRSMQWTLAGLGAGFLGSLAVTQFLASLLYHVTPTDPFVLSTIALLLASVALLASYLPARRATKVDPMVALHYE